MHVVVLRPPSPSLPCADRPYSMAKKFPCQDYFDICSSRAGKEPTWKSWREETYFQAFGVLQRLLS